MSSLPYIATVIVLVLISRAQRRIGHARFAQSRFVPDR
jgi:ABC-type uncharacterized transport system permease subunit